MASPDYMVGNAPAAISYAAPLVGFQLGQALARLPRDYAEGTQRARTLATQNAFPQGMPRKADGSPDVDRIADTALRLGSLGYATPLLNFLAAPQNGNSAAQNSGGSPNTNNVAAGTGKNSASAASVPSATGPANLGVPASKPPPSPQTSNQPMSNAPFAPINSGALPAKPSAQESAPAARGGFDVATAQRHQLVAQHLRASAANYARQNDLDRASDFEQKANTHEVRANEIYDRLGLRQQLRTADLEPAQVGPGQLGPQTRTDRSVDPAPQSGSQSFGQRFDNARSLAGAIGGFAGARQARDGLWYMPDQTRPGRYLLMLHGHG
jgi:hypothetical protein